MNDPFTTTSKCVERLLKEYNKHNRLIVAVDFDDTVFDYHSGGSGHERVLNALRECKKLGFYLVVWTASDPSRFDEMKVFMHDRGIKIDSINENPIPLPFGNHKKIYYNILLDDRAGLGQSLDTLETVITIIKSTQDQPAEQTNICADRAASSLCNTVLRQQGKSYPRTCKGCGLGPCKYPFEATPGYADRWD